MDPVFFQRLNFCIIGFQVEVEEFMDKHPAVELPEAVVAEEEVKVLIDTTFDEK